MIRMNSPACIPQRVFEEEELAGGHLPAALVEWSNTPRKIRRPSCPITYHPRISLIFITLKKTKKVSIILAFSSEVSSFVAARSARICPFFSFFWLTDWDTSLVVSKVFVFVDWPVIYLSLQS